MKKSNITNLVPKEINEGVDQNSNVSSLSPREIVSELDRYVIGQNQAKRAVAIALRNRWRRQALTNEMKDEVLPKNILMVQYFYIYTYFLFLMILQVQEFLMHQLLKKIEHLGSNKHNRKNNVDYLNAKNTPNSKNQIYYNNTSRSNNDKNG